MNNFFNKVQRAWLWLEAREEEKGSGDEGVQQLARRLLDKADGLPALIAMQKEAGLFSRGGGVSTIDDVPTADLRHLLAHYYAGLLYLKLAPPPPQPQQQQGRPGNSNSSSEEAEAAASVPQTRLTWVQRGRAHLSVFLSQCKQLGLVDQQTLDQVEQAAQTTVSPEQRRALKIARYQQEKECRQALAQLTAARDRQRKVRGTTNRRRLYEDASQPFYPFSGLSDGGGATTADNNDDDDFRPWRPSETIGSRAHDDDDEQADDAELNLFASEETARTFWLRTLDWAVIQSLSQLDQSKMEAEMLQQVCKRIAETPGGPAQFQQEMKRDRERAAAAARDAAAAAAAEQRRGPAIGGAFSVAGLTNPSTSMAPVQTGAASLVSKLSGARDRVFRPGWTQPTLTPEQAAEAEMALAAFNQSQKQQAQLDEKRELVIRGQLSIDEERRDQLDARLFASGSTAAAGSSSRPSESDEADDEAAAAKERLTEADDEAALLKARGWDDWKDDHKRGSGNTYNQG